MACGGGCSYSCSSYSTPGPGTSTCCRCHHKKKQKEKKEENSFMEISLLSFTFNCKSLKSPFKSIKLQNLISYNSKLQSKKKKAGNLSTVLTFKNWYTPLQVGNKNNNTASSSPASKTRVLVGAWVQNLFSLPSSLQKLERYAQLKKTKQNKQTKKPQTNHISPPTLQRGVASEMSSEAVRQRFEKSPLPTPHLLLKTNLMPGTPVPTLDSWEAEKSCAKMTGEEKGTSPSL